MSPGSRANRCLTDPQCSPLAEAAAVLIALALETGAATAQPESEPEHDSESKTETVAPASATGAGSQAASVVEEPQTGTSTPESASPAQTNTRAHDRGQAQNTRAEGSDGTAPNRLRLQLSASARAGLGTLPHLPALGVQAQVAARIRPLYIALGLTYWPAREQSSPSYQSAQLRGSGVFADLSLGVDVTRLPVVLTPGLNIEVGQLSAQAVGIGGPEVNRVLWVAAGPSGSIGVSVLKNWTIGLELSGLVSVYRTHWLVRTPMGAVPAFVAARVSSRLSLRVGYTFP